MKLVEKHKIYKSHPAYSKLDSMSRKSNNLYNQCIYLAKHSDNLSEDLRNTDKIMKSFPDEHLVTRSALSKLSVCFIRIYVAISLVLKIINSIQRSILVNRDFRNFENQATDFK